MQTADIDLQSIPQFPSRCRPLSPPLPSARSKHSVGSSKWQCAPCTANVTNPNCTLCPRKGGAFLRVRGVTFVHAFCAARTPGAKIIDPPHVKNKPKPSKAAMAAAATAAAALKEAADAAHRSADDGTQPMLAEAEAIGDERKGGEGVRTKAAATAAAAAASLASGMKSGERDGAGEKRETSGVEGAAPKAKRGKLGTPVGKSKRSGKAVTSVPDVTGGKKGAGAGRGGRGGRGGGRGGRKGGKRIAGGKSGGKEVRGRSGSTSTRVKTADLKGVPKVPISLLLEHKLGERGGGNRVC